MGLSPSLPGVSSMLGDGVGHSCWQHLWGFLPPPLSPPPPSSWAAPARALASWLLASSALP